MLVCGSLLNVLTGRSHATLPDAGRIPRDSLVSLHDHGPSEY